MRDVTAMLYALIVERGSRLETNGFTGVYSENNNRNSVVFQPALMQPAVLRHGRRSEARINADGGIVTSPTKSTKTYINLVTRV